VCINFVDCSSDALAVGLVDFPHLVQPTLAQTWSIGMLLVHGNEFIILPRQGSWRDMVDRHFFSQRRFLGSAAIQLRLFGCGYPATP
jgi:hypothetical protein